MKLFRLDCARGVLLLLMAAGRVRAADATVPATRLAAALPPEKWHQVETSVDRALAWLATQQLADGSFLTESPQGQPAITSLSVMAFLSRGHQPGHGPYGQQLNRAIDFVLACQQNDGLISFQAPAPEFEAGAASHTASYNHFISGLMLGEVYGHVTGQRAKSVKAAIAKALVFARGLQTRTKPWGTDAGGVRYLRQKPGEGDSDLSATAWYLMFLRSAKNAEFRVPQNYVDEALEYVRRCWDPDSGMFCYMVGGNGGYGASRGTTGAGILSLSLAGQHNSQMARAAGDWLLQHPFRDIGQSFGPWDRYYYSAYYCSQAAAQLGGHYWEGIFPSIIDTFLRAQADNGSFPIEPQQNDAMFGRAYATAMAVLAMTPAYQLLPVYQR